MRTSMSTGVWIGRLASWLLLGLLPGCVIVNADFGPFSSRPQSLSEREVSGKGRAKIVVLDISRVITNAQDEGPLGLSSRPGLTARLREELEQAADDDRVGAVVLRLNSPGGTVTASDTIYHEITAFKAKRNVPVVAHMLDFATSGAYYVALAADEIVASPTTVTGSIGVIMVGLNLSDLMGKIGVRNQTLKTGARKDAGSPLRPMTAEDEALLQGVLDGMQQRFVSLVRERRPQMSDDDLAKISDGRVVLADEALRIRLVDRIGYFEDAVDVARRRAGVAEARVIMYRRPSEYAENIYSRAGAASPQINLVNLDLGKLTGGPQFLYLWAPEAGMAPP
jgi:protease-4